MRINILSFIFCLLTVSAANGQIWTGPYQLTSSPASDINPSSCKEWLFGELTCLVWQTDRNGNWDIYSQFCTMTNGNGWGPEVPVCQDSADDVNPAVACCNDWLDHPSYWCVWERRESPWVGSVLASFITFRDSWPPPVRISRVINPPNESAGPSIIVIKNLQDTVWVVWCEHDTGGYCIRYSYYDGISWSQPLPAVWSGGQMRHARIGRGYSSRHQWVQYPLLVWEQEDDVYFSEYINGAWTLPAEVAASPTSDKNPEIISFCSMPLQLGPWIIWQSDRDEDTAIFGTTPDSFTTCHRWCDTALAGNNFNPCGTPAAFTTDQEGLVAVWESDRDGNQNIYSTNPFSPSYSDVRVDADTADDVNPTLTTMGLTMLWCCWQSDRTGNWDIFGSYIYSVGIEEERVAPRFNSSASPTICRGAIKLFGSHYAVLLDIAGRKVAELKPGINNVRYLAPGVYFLRRETENKTVKVIVQR